MNIYIGAVSGLLMLASAVLANGNDVQQGGFIGSRLSMLIPTDRAELTDAAASSPFSTRYDQGNRVGLNIHGGYQWLFAQRYVFALQAAVNHVFGRTNGTTLDGHIDTPQVAFPITFSLAARPGVLINQYAQLFGLLGATSARISMRQMYDTIPFSINSWQPGLLLGLGVSTSINQQSVITLDYQYEYYPSISQFASNTRNNFNVQLYPRAQSVGLSYNYFFTA